MLARHTFVCYHIGGENIDKIEISQYKIDTLFNKTEIIIYKSEPAHGYIIKNKIIRLV